MLYIIRVNTRGRDSYKHTFTLRESLLYYWKNVASKYDLASFQVETYKDGRLIAASGKKYGR